VKIGEIRRSKREVDRVLFVVVDNECFCSFDIDNSVEMQNDDGELMVYLVLFAWDYRFDLH